MRDPNTREAEAPKEEAGEEGEEEVEEEEDDDVGHVREHYDAYAAGQTVAVAVFGVARVHHF